jgi:hypothetical protein
MAIILPVSSAQAKIVEILHSRMATAADLAKMLRGYDEFKIQSMILTLARKGKVDKTKAALILRGTEMVKFLNYPLGSQLKGAIPEGKRR